MTTKTDEVIQMAAETGKQVLNVDIIRKDFPILNRKIHGNRIVYLDSAATTQKPACVINALSFFYRTSNANIHRGAYTLSEIAQETGAVLKHIPVTEDGYLDMDIFYKLLSERTKVVSVTMVSNVLGTINPVSEIIKAAHSYNAVTVLDGAQGVPHTKVDAKELDCDFLAFSAHKMLGPTGIGVMYGKPELLEKMEPVLTGGGMIQEVTLNSATWAEIPWKFEAGTPNYADVIAFSSAIDYLENLSMDAIRIHEKELTAYTLERLETFPDLTVYGPRDIEHRAGVVAFYDKLIHPHDISTILDSYGIAIRAGHHCAQPLMRRYNIPANVRVSFYIYNDKADVDALIEGLKKAREYFQYGTS